MSTINKKLKNISILSQINNCTDPLTQFPDKNITASLKDALSQFPFMNTLAYSTAGVVVFMIIFAIIGVSAAFACKERQQVEPKP